VLCSSIKPVPRMLVGWMVSLLELLSCAGRKKIQVNSCNFYIESFEALARLRFYISASSLLH
jgi:hypothetical protein